MAAAQAEADALAADLSLCEGALEHAAGRAEKALRRWQALEEALAAEQARTPKLEAAHAVAVEVTSRLARNDSGRRGT